MLIDMPEDTSEDNYPLPNTNEIVFFHWSFRWSFGSGSDKPPIPQPPPKPLFSWGNWLKGAGDWLKGAGDWVGGILEGDFNENPSNSQIIARLLVTLIPGIDTVGDVQDLAAALFKLIWQKRFVEVGVWTDLVLTGIGFIPEFGSVFKGVFKLILKEGTKFEDIAKYLKHLGIDDAAGLLRKLSNNLDQYGDMTKQRLTQILDKISQEAKKFLPPEQAEELLKQIDEAKKRLPEEVDKLIAELKRRIDEILGENTGGVKISKPKRTKSTGKIGGKPTEKRTKVEGSTQQKRALEKENDSADILAKNGYQVEQNPGTLPNGKNPDYRIEGDSFDCYSPTSNKVDQIRKGMSDKVSSGQTDRIILNLDDVPVSPRTSLKCCPVNLKPVCKKLSV